MDFRYAGTVQDAVELLRISGLVLIGVEKFRYFYLLIISTILPCNYAQCSSIGRARSDEQSLSPLRYPNMGDGYDREIVEMNSPYICYKGTF
jgi:hypothetical protein